MDGHKIETTITIRPPSQGYAGSNFTSYVEVTIDGQKRIDCSIGYARGYDNLNVSSVAIYPEAGTIDISATTESESGERSVSPPFESWFFKSKTLIDNQAILNGDNQEQPSESENSN